MRDLLEKLSTVVERKESDLFSPEGSVSSSSHPVQPMRSQGGGKWFSKGAPGNPLLVVNEYITYLMYRVYGLSVARGATLALADNGSIRIVTSQVDGEQVSASSDPSVSLKSTDFKAGFFVDAMLGNWDVVGNAPRFNVFVDKGKATRIDTGGLDFRALGARKGGGFGTKVTELDSFAGLLGGKAMSGSHAAKVFSSMNEADFRLAAAVFLKVPWQKIAATFGATKKLVDRLGDKELSALVRKYIADVEPVLKKRHAHVLDVIEKRQF